MDEGAVVAQDDESAGFPVESADGFRWGLAPQPWGREEIVEQGSFCGIVGAGEANGFVECHEETVWELDGLTVHRGGGGVDAVIGPEHGFSAAGDAAGADP